MKMYRNCYEDNPPFCFQFRPRHNPLAWPLAPPAKDPSSDAAAAISAAVKKDSVGALNPNVPEFVPSFGAAVQQPGMTPFSAVNLTRLMDKG